MKYVRLPVVLFFATFFISCTEELVPPVNDGALVPEMILITGGTFAMGSADGVGESDENPQHTVTVSSYSIGKFEISREQWQRVILLKQGKATRPLDPDPSFFKTSEKLPVENVTWEDIQIWLGYLNQIEGLNNSPKKFRLPTEAEWEYAARGGAHWTDDRIYSGSDSIAHAAWYWENSGNKTHVVGLKSANQLGFHDMSGNVTEWCQDWYGLYVAGTQTDPTGPISGTYRVLRGGSYQSYGINCRVADRGFGNPADRGGDGGFRIARSQ